MATIHIPERSLVKDEPIIFHVWAPEPVRDSKVEYKCESCGKSYSIKKSLDTHKRRKCFKVLAEEIGQHGTRLCCEPGCGFRYPSLRYLREHLEIIHDKEMHWEKLNFSSSEEFVEWKADYERNTNSSFFKRGQNQFKKQVTDVLYCNRSGYYKSRSTGKRKTKSQGSSKINKYCTAIIKATTSRVNGSITVQVCHTHYGHDIQLGHLRLPKVDRNKIALKLIQGVEPETIIKELRPDASSKLERKHLLVTKDLRNICQAYGIPNVNLKKRKRKDLEPCSNEESIVIKTESLQHCDENAQKESCIYQIDSTTNHAIDGQNFGADNILGGQGFSIAQNECHSIEMVKRNLIDKIMGLCEKIDSCINEEAILTVDDHITAVYNVFESFENY